MVVVAPPPPVVVVRLLATVSTGVPELVVAPACARYHVPPKATISSPADLPGPESPTNV